MQDIYTRDENSDFGETFMILRYCRYIKNRIMTHPKKNIITIVGTTGVGKSQVRYKKKSYETILIS